MSSDSDEELRDQLRIERIAKKHVEQGTWVLDGNSTSDEEFIEHYATEYGGIDELISEFNNQKRELKESMPPEFKISKLVEADGPRSRNEIERLIKEHDIDINSVYLYEKLGKGNLKPIEPIFLHIKSGPMYKMLKKYGVINMAGLNGETLLHRACRHGYKPLIKLLLQSGMDVDVVDNQGRTPLFYCSDLFSVSDILLKHGANINHQSNNGINVLLASLSPRWGSWGIEKKIDHFIKNGGDINAKDNEGNTVLNYVMAIFDKEISSVKRDDGYSIYPEGTTLQDIYNKHLPAINNLFEHGLSPFNKGKTSGKMIGKIPAEHYYIVKELYTNYLCRLLNAKQKLALANLFIKDNEPNFPVEVIQMISELLELPPEISEGMRKNTDKVFFKILKESIQELYPSFDTDDMVKRYKELLSTPGLNSRQKEMYQKQLNRRIISLKDKGISVKSRHANKSRRQIRTKIRGLSRHSRSVSDKSIPNKSERASRSVGSKKKIKSKKKMKYNKNKRR